MLARRFSSSEVSATGPGTRDEWGHERVSLQKTHAIQHRNTEEQFEERWLFLPTSWPRNVN